MKTRLLAGVLALCPAEVQASAQHDIWAETTTYICTIDRPDGAKTLLALQTSGNETRINVRVIGLNGWPEKQVLSSDTAPITAPIPPFEGGLSHLASFDAKIADRPYRFHFTISYVPLLREHKPIEANGKLLTNRSATLSISALRRGTTATNIGVGYCEAQKDSEIFNVIGNKDERSNP